MSRVMETTVYQFAELSDKAKERARDWFRQCIESDELANYDDWQAIAKILGIEFKTRPIKLMGGSTRYDPCIYWSGFSSQGDGASFEGSYSYAKGATKAIRAYAPLDTVLHGIADDLQAVQQRHFYKLQASISQHGSYSHSHTMQIEVEHGDDSYRDLGDDADVVTQAMRDFADWIYRYLEKEWEYQNSNEVIDDNITANEYEFTAEGRIV